jgi:hypothetical protein
MLRLFTKFPGFLARKMAALSKIANKVAREEIGYL